MKTGPLAAACTLAAAVLVTHLPLLDAGYVQDDHVAIEGNAIVESGSLSAIFGAAYWEGSAGATGRSTGPSPWPASRSSLRLPAARTLRSPTRST